MPVVRDRRRAERNGRRLAAGRGVMTTAASAVVALGAVAGLMSAAGRGGEDDTARPEVRSSPVTVPLPARPSRPPSAPAQPSGSPLPPPPPERSAAPAPASPASRPAPRTGPPDAPGLLHRHPRSQVLDWVREHRDDPRRPLIEARIAAHPAAVWFPEHDPGRIRGEVRAVTAGAAAAGRVPVLVPYAIPDRDCGGASQGGAPDLAAYDAWTAEFAAGLGREPVIVVLEPDSIALSGCLSDGLRAARYASLARAARAMKAANPQARVYFDAGHSGWHPAARQAAELRAAGAAASGDGIFTNVSNFHRTGDETRYARRVLEALGGPPGLGAVIDTSRNGNGAPEQGAWCDPSGRALGRTPTTETGESRIDAYLWVKLPGESDGCRGAAGTFTPDYAFELATG
ncbi:glycoside hydrolase family 6 protein [Streptomyces spongiicola]|uniref:glycoside hydrolase family 6 protein n=1 Tax=Streptomyces spongiicola TaxID=1690221 RepID=UPI000E2E897E|nr:glycoside hydrolase family 6 protein [Streptomyces spongiicola]